MPGARTAPTRSARRAPTRTHPSRPIPAPMAASPRSTDRRAMARPRRTARPQTRGPAVDGAAPRAEILLYPVPASVAEVCGRYAEAYCTKLKQCLPARFATEHQLDELCRARRNQSCRVDFLVPARNEVASGRAACTRALTSQSCRDFALGRALAACEAPPGDLTMGAPCARSSQCGRGLLCKTELVGCGTCQPAIPIGGDCGWWYGGCAAGSELLRRPVSGAAQAG